jgi:hypothetical protein
MPTLAPPLTTSSPALFHRGFLKVTIRRCYQPDDCLASPFFVLHLLPSTTNPYLPRPDLLLFHPLPLHLHLTFFMPSSCCLLAVSAAHLLSSFSRAACLEPAASSLLEATKRSDLSSILTVSSVFSVPFQHLIYSNSHACFTGKYKSTWLFLLDFVGELVIPS